MSSKVDSSVHEPSSLDTEKQDLPVEPRLEGVSSLSLSSIALKKKASAITKTKSEAEKLREKVEASQMLQIWTDYTTKKEQEGAQNIAAILKLCNPTLDQETVHLSVPNNINKKELQMESNTLLPHLKAALKNDYLQFNITVNEAQQEQFVYTAAEKYKKFEAINPALKNLKDTFGLEF